MREEWEENTGSKALFLSLFDGSRHVHIASWQYMSQPEGQLGRGLGDISVPGNAPFGISVFQWRGEKERFLPWHSLALSLATLRIWIYKCEKNVVCFWGWSLLVSFVWHAGLWGDCTEQALFLMQTLWDRPSCLQRLLTTPASTKLLVIYCIYYTVF